MVSLNSMMRVVGQDGSNAIKRHRLGGLLEGTHATARGVWPAYSYDISALDVFYLSKFSSKQLRELYWNSSAIRRAVDTVTKQIASLPLAVVPMADTTPEQFRHAQRLFSSLNRAGSTFYEGMIEAISDLLVLDRAVWVKTFDVRGRLVELYPLDAATVAPMRDKNGILRGYKQTAFAGGRRYTVEFAPHEIIWMQGCPKTYSRQAFPIISSIYLEIQALITANNSLNDLTDMNYVPPYLLSFSNPLDDKALLRLEADFRSKKGVRMIPGMDDHKLTALGYSPENTRIVDVRQVLERVIYGHYGLIAPSAQVQPDQGTFRRSGHQKGSSLVEPTAQLLSAKFTACLEKDLNVRVVVMPRVELSALEAANLKNAGVITQNETRKVIGFPETQEGDSVQLVNPQGVMEYPSTPGAGDSGVLPGVDAGVASEGGNPARSHNGNGNENGNLKRSHSRIVGTPLARRFVKDRLQLQNGLRREVAPLWDFFEEWSGRRSSLDTSTKR